MKARAAKLGVDSHDCQHCFVDAEKGYICVCCGAETRVPAQHGPDRHTTRMGAVCGCCGSTFTAEEYCTTCGARIGYRTTIPPGSRETFKLFAKYTAYLDRRDPHFRFKLDVSGASKWLLAIVVMLAVQVAVIGSIWFVRYETRRNDLEKRFSTAELEAQLAILDEVAKTGYDPDMTRELECDYPELFATPVDTVVSQVLEILSGGSPVEVDISQQERELLENSTHYNEFVPYYFYNHAKCMCDVVPRLYYELMDSAFKPVKTEILESIESLRAEKASELDGLKLRMLLPVLLIVSLPLAIVCVFLFVVARRVIALTGNVGIEYPKSGVHTGEHRTIAYVSKPRGRGPGSRGTPDIPSASSGPKPAAWLLKGLGTLILVLSVEYILLGSMALGYYYIKMKPELDRVGTGTEYSIDGNRFFESEFEPEMTESVYEKERERVFHSTLPGGSTLVLFLAFSVLIALATLWAIRRLGDHSRKTSVSLE